MDREENRLVGWEEKLGWWNHLSGHAGMLLLGGAWAFAVRRERRTVFRLKIEMEI
jgi:hypothetical protein